MCPAKAARHLPLCVMRVDYLVVCFTCVARLKEVAIVKMSKRGTEAMSASL